MKNEVYFGISVRIIVVFMVAMLWTFVPDQLRVFFNDTECVKSCIGIDAGWEWGARHYWYWWMMFLLFILSIVSAVMQCVKLVEKNYKI